MTTYQLDPVIVESDLAAMGTSLSTIRNYIAQAAKQAGLAQQSMHRLRLAVDEIATNIIVHGYSESGLVGEVKIGALIDDEMLTIVLEDTAAPFDPRTRGTPKNLNDPLETREFGGLGVFLAISNVDKFDYERLGNRNINRFGMKRNNGVPAE
jgi:serine/threonine-protein kinase RsbW